jgi:hypothetical protein
MKRSVIALLLCLPLSLVGNAHAQVAGTTSIGVADLTLVANGWSVKKKVLGKTVYNEENKRVGKIEDIIVAPDGSASFIIVGAGGFLGVARHDVAVPVGQIVVQDDKFVLPGATKDAVKGMAKFVYAK